MRKAGRQPGNAVLRTLADKDQMNFATQRLLRDLKEIDDEKIPTVGVVARPSECDLFKWFANIRGPKDTPYEDGVFHFELEIPESYPHQPPKIKCCTELPHPNVFDGYICLDMLQATRGKSGEGWSSSYSILSILIQLQSFLFEQNFDEEKEKWILKVKKAVKAANEYQCPFTKHKGRLGCWPPFNTNEGDLSFFVIPSYEEKSEFRKELSCYHSKDDHLENCLGLGLTVTKLPRTGAIKEAVLTHDYISLKAFVKEGIRWSSLNEQFNLWLPLYFSIPQEEQQKYFKDKNDKTKTYQKGMERERTIHLGERAISMIISNNTKRFQQDDALEVFTQLIVTMSFHMMDEKVHPSIRVIRVFTHIHALGLLIFNKYPGLFEKVDTKIEEFIKDPSKRHKDSCPNLGSLNAMLLFSKKFQFNDLVEVYSAEQMDRQVLWLLKSIPELDPKTKREVDLSDENRPKISFKSLISSYQMLCYYNLYLKTVKGNSDPLSLLKMFESNYCKLPNQMEEELQRGIKQIHKEISDYNSFYRYIGMKEKQTPELNKMLIEAVNRSKEKKYHGTIQELNTLPSNLQQIRALNQKLPKIQDFYDISTIKPEKIVAEKKPGDALKSKEQDQQHQGENVKYVIKQKRNFQEEEWKVACVDRWIWIREVLDLKRDLTPTDLMELNLQNYQFPQNSILNRLNEFIQEKVKRQNVQFEAPRIPIPTQTWKKLFLTLDLVDFLLQIDMNPDFNSYYEKLEVVRSEVDTLVVPIFNVRNLKSGFHFLTALLTRLTQLTYLEISGNPNSNSLNLPPKASKCLYKGFSNFKKEGGSLQYIVFSKFTAEGNPNDVLERFFTPIALMQHLISIRFYGTNLLTIPNASQSLGNVITTLKDLQELIVTRYAINNVTQAKDIADGIMRAKQLRFINVSENSCGTAGLASIVYNLAFSPKLVYLNLSKNSTAGNIAELVESLYKMLRISASLEILDLSAMAGVNPALSKDFFMSLGEIKTLRMINFKGSGILNDVVNLGKALAFNAKKNGSLNLINFENCFNNINSINSLALNMHISAHDEESWYGDPNKAAKMTGVDFNKVYYNNLKGLLLSGCASLVSNFNLSNQIQFNQEDNQQIQFFARSKSLETLLMGSTGLNKNDADLLSLALDPTRPGFCSRIRILDLSQNSFGKEGAKVFSTILEKNNILEIIDLSQNQIGVSGAQAIAKSLEKNKSVKFLNLFNNRIGYDGAKALADALKVNSVLQHIEIGHNRIRDQGFIELAEGLGKNPTSALQILSARFNFITDDGINDFFSTLQKMSKKNSLSQLNIKNNSTTEIGLYQIQKKYENHGFTFNVDLFDQLRHLNPDLLERCIWVHPVFTSGQEIKKFFEQCQKCGIVMDVRLRKGPKYPNRAVQQNYFAIVEFADAASCNRALQVASRQRAIINGNNFRIFQAGTGTFIYSQKSSKEKKAESSKTNVLRNTRVPVANTRGRGRTAKAW